MPVKKTLKIPHDRSNRKLKNVRAKGAKHATLEWRRVSEWEKKAEEYGKQGMAICEQGHRNSTVDSFCVKCGSAVNKDYVVKKMKCQKCGGNQFANYEKFCGKCGHEYGKPWTAADTLLEQRMDNAKLSARPPFPSPTSDKMERPKDRNGLYAAIAVTILIILWFLR